MTVLHALTHFLIRGKAKITCVFRHSACLPRKQAPTSPADRLVCRAAPEGGFTLFEALVGVALMGLILSIIASVTAQWLPNWRTGFGRLQQAELVSLALDRIVSDLAAAEMIAPIGEDPLLFLGSAGSVTLVRSPVGPRSAGDPAPTGLEIIRLADNADEGGLVRSRIAFSPATSVAAKAEDFEFSDMSLLLRAPLRVSFGFAGKGRGWSDTWSADTVLPTAVRITVRNANSDEILAVSTATLIHVDAPAACAVQSATIACLDNKGANGLKPTGPATPAAPPATPAAPNGGVL